MWVKILKIAAVSIAILLKAEHIYRQVKRGQDTPND